MAANWMSAENIASAQQAYRVARKGGASVKAAVVSLIRAGIDVEDAIEISHSCEAKPTAAMRREFNHEED